MNPSRRLLPRALIRSFAHHMQLWVGDIDRNKFHEFGKALVEPQVVPPLHRHQVSKPLGTKTRTGVLKIYLSASTFHHKNNSLISNDEEWDTWCASS